MTAVDRRAVQRIVRGGEEYCKNYNTELARRATEGHGDPAAPEQWGTYRLLRSRWVPEQLQRIAVSLGSGAVAADRRVPEQCKRMRSRRAPKQLRRLRLLWPSVALRLSSVVKNLASPIRTNLPSLAHCEAPR